MMKKAVMVLYCLLICGILFAQKTENVILITLDGLRWQELYTGADSLLVGNSKYVNNPEDLVSEFWVNDPLQRRELLMPFFWSTIAKQGQLYGNRKYNNKIDCTNKLWFSYPGYNELLCGFPDDEHIDSNSKINNENVTILEYLNKMKVYQGKVAAFASWGVFPYIINEERSGVHVNAGFTKQEMNPNEIETFLNRIQDEIRGPWGSARLDIFTHHYAMKYLKANQPKLLYIAYGETDDFGHDGKYDEYLKSARQTDAYIKELWDYVQSEEQYRDKTTLVITTDHGRGTNPIHTWKHHAADIKDAGEIWLAIVGPDTPVKGEIKSAGQYYQNQIARMVVEVLGEKYNQPKAGESINGTFEW